MAKKKGLQWNQLQLLIAKEIIEGKKEPQQLVKDGKFKSSTVYKVAEFLEKGNEPPSLDPEYIANAPKAKKFGEDGGGKEEKAELTPADLQKPPSKGGPQLTTSLSMTTILKLIPQVQALPLTPDIFMSYICALQNGYEGDVGEWLSLVSRDFWLARGRDFYAEVSGVGIQEAEGEG